MFKPKHKWGRVIPTIPKTQMCERCGLHRQVESGDPSLLPKGMYFSLFDQPCQKSEYTQFQIDDMKANAYRHGWGNGQDSGIHLQGEFTQKFFSKIRFNPQTLVYEIPQESYTVLKDMMASHPAPQPPETKE